MEIADESTEPWSLNVLLFYEFVNTSLTTGVWLWCHRQGKRFSKGVLMDTNRCVRIWTDELRTIDHQMSYSKVPVFGQWLWRSW